MFVVGLGWLAHTTRKGLGNEETRGAHHGPSQSEAMEASASAKLAELSAVLASSDEDEPDLDSLYYQEAAEGSSEDEQHNGAVQPPEASSPADYDDESNFFDGL